MALTSSTFTEGASQVDGRRYVTERHESDDGQVFAYEWLGEQDAALVLADRASSLTLLLESKAAAQAVVLGTALPLTVYEFLSRMTPAERIGIRTAAKTNVIVEDFMELLNQSSAVYPTNIDVQAGLGYLASMDLLTAERAAVIGAG